MECTSLRYDLFSIALLPDASVIQAKNNTSSILICMALISVKKQLDEQLDLLLLERVQATSAESAIAWRF